MNNIIEIEVLGGKWWITIFNEIDKEAENQIANKIKNLLKTFENNYSRFLNDSYISQLNRDKVLTKFPEELFELFQLSKAFLKSNGNFNIATGHILEALGYNSKYNFYKRYSDSSSKEFDESILELTKDKIRIDEEVRVDLGGIGKGYIADKVVTLIKDIGYQNFIVNAGGDIYVTSDIGMDVTFPLENPFNIKEKIGEIKASNLGLAASSPSRRLWRTKNTDEVFHHLIDTKTDLSKKGIAAVFTTAENTLIADAAATSLFVCNDEERSEIADSFNVEYLIIYSDKSYFKSKGYLGSLFN
ncbi:MAG: FAD:protein FMN transferase [Candidatus Dojkabacteria bacterium]|nr:FAD:protein FMN transferase [Candidatus Dojkabacteria bacterium]